MNEEEGEKKRMIEGRREGWDGREQEYGKEAWYKKKRKGGRKEKGMRKGRREGRVERREKWRGGESGMKDVARVW